MTEETEYIIRGSGHGVGLAQDNRQLEKEFIATYEKLPLLWNSEHPDYTNKYKRNEALDVLLRVMKKWNDDSSRYDVRKKINILRSCYRKDLRRQLASQATIGVDGEIVYEYKPASWKFYALQFLNGDDLKRYRMGGVKLETSHEEHITDESISGAEEPASHIEIPYSETQFVETNNESFAQIATKKRRLKRVKVQYQEEQYENSEEREYAAIGSNVSCKLRRMNDEQRCHAELLIHKVLINGLQNNLTGDTDLTEVYKAD